MSAAVVRLPDAPCAAARLWAAYERARDAYAARWPNVGVEDMRCVVNAFDAATAALARSGR